MEQREERARSFGSAADLYDEVRPRYPAEALSWALGDAPVRVADLGAGTGILTRGLVALGHEVTAVEPDPLMRERCAATVPAATVVAGTAEAIPLAGGSVDAVVAGQAYHWFRQDRAHPEIARVLRSGGVFAPIWNLRDDRVPWVRELTAVLRDAGADSGVTPPVLAEPFGPLAEATFEHAVEHSVDSLIALLRSRSYYLTAGPAIREDLEQGVRRLAATHPDLAGRQAFDLPYRTVVYRAYRN